MSWHAGGGQRIPDTCSQAGQIYLQACGAGGQALPSPNDNTEGGAVTVRHSVTSQPLAQ